MIGRDDQEIIPAQAVQQIRNARIECFEGRCIARDISAMAVQRVEIDEIREDEVILTTETGESMTLPNDVVFVLVGSDADLTLLKQLGVQTEAGKIAEVPVYDTETFETSVRGVYVAGHFTHARHIKAAIDVPRRIVPLIAQDLRK